MDFTSSMMEDYTTNNLMAVPPPGCQRSIDQDMFKISIEEAIGFMKQFKADVENNYLKLLEIYTKKEYRKKYGLAAMPEEEKNQENLTTHLFESLETQLKRWSFSHAGVSLKKVCEQDEVDYAREQMRNRIHAQFTSV